MIHTIKTGELHIWRYTLNEKEYNDEQIAPILSEEEKEKYKRFIHQRDVIKYIGNHRFMRQVLSKYVHHKPNELVFNQTALGKPYIKDSGLYFSLSYRNQCGLLAISKDDEVGVDIEYMKELQDTSTFASYSFSEEEKALIFKTNTADFDLLFTFWAFKEAFIKATGTGLSVDISKINLADFLNHETLILPYDNTLWSLKSLSIKEGYKAAVAIRGQMPYCTGFNYDESSPNLFKNSPLKL